MLAIDNMSDVGPITFQGDFMKAFNERFKIKFLVYLLVSSMTLTEILNRKISKELFKSQTGVYVPTNYGSRIIN